MNKIEAQLMIILMVLAELQVSSRQFWSLNQTSAVLPMAVNERYNAL